MTTRTPTTIDPRNLDRIIGKTTTKDLRTGKPMTESVLEVLRRAMGSAHDAATKAGPLREKILANQMQTEIANAKQAEIQLHDMQQAAAGKLDEALTRTRSAVKALKEKTAPPEAPDGPMGAEVRARVAAMGKSDRQRVLAGAVETGDAKTVGAVVSAPPWLSGLSEPEHAALGQNWVRTHHSDLIRKHDAYLAAIEKTEIGGQAMIAYISGLIDRRAIAAAQATEDAAEKAIADARES